MQGAQKLRSEAHWQGALQRRSWSATPQMDFLRNHQKSLAPLFMRTPDRVRGRRRNQNRWQSWIQGRASLAWNDDLPLFPSVFQTLSL